MALSLQDFLKGLSFSALGTFTGTDLNNLVDESTPFIDSPTEGKGIILHTIDTALGVPEVPDPTISGSYNKWKLYIWKRTPFPGATIKTPTIFGWNDDAPNDPTFKKWLQLVQDTTQIETDITNLQSEVNIAQSTAANAAAVANQALTEADNAEAAALNALNIANGLNAAVNQANTNASNAVTTANGASAAVTAMQTDVNNIKNVSIPGLQALNLSYAILAETAAATNSLGGIAAGQNTRNINSTLSDTKGLTTLAGGLITIVNAGTYYIRAVVPFVTDLSGGDTQKLQVYIKKNSDNSVYAAGQSTGPHVSGIGGFSFNLDVPGNLTVEGIISVTAGTVIRIDMHSSVSQGFLGKAGQDGTGHFPAAQPEVYTIVEIKQLA